MWDLTPFDSLAQGDVRNVVMPNLTLLIPLLIPKWRVLHHGLSCPRISPSLLASL